jgi:diadenosine tetraphosphate (Ap4A) HIT family hydrolase
MGGTIEPGCLGCAIARGDVAPPGGAIVETARFHAHQDVSCPIPGFVILATRRHVRCFDELTDDEAAEHGRLVRRLRAAQRAVLGAEHVYYFLNEDTRHHFHSWLLPRLGWMDAFGRYVESVRPILTHAREHLNGPEQRAEVERVATRLREYLQGD